MGNKRFKIVYVVTGSEDGILGVYGNKKAAYKEAMRYVEDCNSWRKLDLKLMSYSQVCKELKDVYNYSVDIIESYVDFNASIITVPYNVHQKG